MELLHRRCCGLVAGLTISVAVLRVRGSRCRRTEPHRPTMVMAPVELRRGTGSSPTVDPGSVATQAVQGLCERV